MDTVRIGLIGAGGNTRSRHIPGFLNIDGVELVCVANRTLDSARRVAEEFAIARPVAHWREVLEDESVDAVCIGTWPYMHAPLTVAALEHGKHVLCEARMAMNATEAHAMRAAARRYPELVAQIVPAPHTLPVDRTVISMIASGQLGEIVALDARVAVSSSYANPGAPLHWRHDRDLSGNNIMGLGIWYEALMRWVGPMSAVCAVGQTVVRHRLDADGHRKATDIPDYIDVTGPLAQGGQMRLCVTTVAGHPPSPADVLIYGTEGTLQVRQGADGLTVSAARRGDAAPSVVEPDPALVDRWRVEEEFVNAIRGLEPVRLTDFDTGVRYMEWTDAVQISMSCGVRVPLPLQGGV